MSCENNEGEVIVLDDALVLMEKGQEGGEGKREGAEEPKAEDESLDAFIEEEEEEEETVESPPVLQEQQLEAKEGEELEEEEEEKEGELDEEEEKQEEEESQQPQQLISRAATPSPPSTSRPPSPLPLVLLHTQRKQKRTRITWSLLRLSPLLSKRQSASSFFPLRWQRAFGAASFRWRRRGRRCAWPLDGQQSVVRPACIR